MLANVKSYRLFLFYIVQLNAYLLYVCRAQLRDADVRIYAVIVVKRWSL